METLTIEVTQDHIDRLAKARKPILGIAELIWNSVDADATTVAVRLNQNRFGSIDTIEVIDNGLGITMTEAKTGFGHLGGSWKQREKQTKRDKRILHGRQGQGRFRAFALCERAEWQTVYLSEGSLKQFSILGNSDNKRQFTISDENTSKQDAAGTTVVLSNLIENQGSLHPDKAISELNKLLAIYLKQYPQVRVSYDSAIVDPSALEENRADYPLPPFLAEDGNVYTANLTIIEWNIDIERALYLCTDAGFTLRELPPGIHAHGYRFTAYLRSKLLEQMDEAGTLDMEDFTDLRKLLDVTKDQMRSHFLQQDAKKASGVVEKWKADDVYPFDGFPRNVMEETERQIFDVVAVNLDSYISDFREVKPKAKKLTFSLLRYALESNPSSMQFILSEVVGLPKDKQDELAVLLQKTSLIAMINASKIVTERLDFLKGLEYLLYDPESRPTLQERAQLHKMVSRNTWIFGDEYFLVNNEETLTTVLRKHLKGVLFDVDLETPVLREDQSVGRIDLGLSNIPPDEQIAGSDVVIAKELGRQPTVSRNHLIVELKRPRQDITSEVISQARSYAFAIAKDERFHNLPTNWSIWAVSNRLSEEAQLEAQMDGQPQGVVYQSKPDAKRNYNITIWAKPWSEIIEQCAGRLRFFQERLNYNASHSSGKQFLQQTYPKFIPKIMKDNDAEKVA